MALETSHDDEEIKKFICACFNGNLEAVKTFVTNGYDLNITQSYSLETIYGSFFYDMNGFQIACLGGNLNVVQFLFEHFQIQRFHQDSIWGCREFFLATFSKNLSLVEYLVNMNSHNTVTQQHFSRLLRIACKENNMEMAKCFLQYGADINFGLMGALHVAKKSGFQNFEFLEWVLEKGADVNFIHQSVNNRNLFHFACLEGSLKLVKFLMQNGIDFKNRDTNGCDGFKWACLLGNNIDLVLFLLPYGFDMNRLNQQGETFVEFLIGDGRDLIRDELQSKHRLKSYLRIILTLMEHGGQVRTSYVTERLIIMINRRIVKITIIKNKIFEIFTGRIAQTITDFTMLPTTSTSLQNLTQIISNLESSSGEE